MCACYNRIHRHNPSLKSSCSPIHCQVTCKRFQCLEYPAFAKIVGISSRGLLFIRAAVSIPSETSDRTTRASSKPHSSGNLQRKAVFHLRRLADAAKGISPTLTPARLSKARCREVKDLLAVAGLAPGASKLSGASVDALGAKCLADLLWALGVLGDVHYLQEEMEAVLQVVDFQRQDFTLKGLADVSWSLATAHHWTPKLADLAAEVVVLGGLKEIRANYHFTGLLWSFAILNFDPPNLLNEVPPPQRVASFNPVQLINACWSLCVLQEMQSELFKCLWRELGTRDLTAIENTKHTAAQLSQIKMSSNEGGGALLVTDTHERILEEADRRWRRLLATDDYRGFGKSRASVEGIVTEGSQQGAVYVQMSAQHADTCRALRSMGMDYVIEDVSSGYAVDIAIPELRIAIEIDGPFHFARNVKRRLGPSAMKHRHLIQRGWHVFPLTAEDWISAESSSEALQDLRDLILTQRGAV